VRAFNTQPAAVNTVLPVPDKANAVFVAGLSIRMRDESPDYPAMVVANYILGGGGLSSRLADRLRQKDGLSYSVGSGFSADPRDEDALFQAYAIYNPENAAKLEQGFREELARAVRAGFTDAEVAAAKGGLLQARVLARTGDATLARSLATQQDLGRTFRTSAELDAKIAALTTAQVNAALRKYVDPAKVSVFKVGTFR
jgi:zinc protease